MLFPDLLRFTPQTFTVSYGINFPDLEAVLARVTGQPQAPGLAVAHQLRPHYSFQPPRTAATACEKALRDVENEALPWFSTVSTFDDAVSAFFAQRIAPGLNGVAAPRGWVVYGLLRELGREL
jgi:hypothetical protein